MNKNYVFFNSNKKLLHVYICCARPNGRTVRHITCTTYVKRTFEFAALYNYWRIPIPNTSNFLEWTKNNTCK